MKGQRQMTLDWRHLISNGHYECKISKCANISALMFRQGTRLARRALQIDLPSGRYARCTTNGSVLPI